jgi:glycolate dehydrogenase iron-sulfur subunit
MRTNFSLVQLSAPDFADAERNLRACVHCGICTATCPTYVLTGDERDGPRGRIVMMQHMLESGVPPTAETVYHVDRCLSCLGCRTACPSGVDYARIADAARNYIEINHERPRRERAMRDAIAFVMARPIFLRLALALARAFAPVSARLPGSLGVMARKAASSKTIRAPRADATRTPAANNRRIAQMPGCVQQALAPAIDPAAERVLARRGMTVTTLRGAGCCGALAHHLGRRDEARAWAQQAIAAFERAGDPEAILITATGCAAHLIDYPHLFADDPEWKPRAEAFAAKVRDFSQLAAPESAQAPERLRIAHHVPCSAQHGLGLSEGNAAALAAAGYEIVEVPEGHLCCGSAGSYSLLQPEMAGALRARKLANIATLAVDAVASANVGCLVHLSGPDAPPVIHPAELIDWAEGGPRPAALLPAKTPVTEAISR